MSGSQAHSSSAQSREPLLTAAQIAKRFAVSQAWVYQAVADGRLPYRRLGREGGPVRFVASEIDARLETQRRGHHSFTRVCSGGKDRTGRGVAAIRNLARRLCGLRDISHVVKGMGSVAMRMSLIEIRSSSGASHPAPQARSRDGADADAKKGAVDGDRRPGSRMPTAGARRADRSMTPAAHFKGCLAYHANTRRGAEPLLRLLGARPACPSSS
jgi:excisionase family DNA binding protein